MPKISTKTLMMGDVSKAALASLALLLSPAFAEDTANAVPAASTIVEQGTESGSADVKAPENQAEAQASVADEVDSNASQKLAEKRATLLRDAAIALEQSRQAVIFLADGDPEAALEALAEATGKLEVIVAREPDLALAPVSVTASRQDLIATVEDVKALRKTIEELVEDGKIQEARPLAESFGSEFIITTTSIPLATYPDAIKEVAALIDDGEIEAAKVALDAALSTLVVTEQTIPIPLLRADAMLSLAEAVLAEGEDDAFEVAEQLRQNAAYEVQLAKAFGYGDKSLYRKLERDLERLEDRIEDKKDSSGLLKSLRRQVANLMPGENS
ncbi:YfdX family protein [Parvularcula lutaonensis]|uniref:YfdX family protein n=1 Tax=Parvularcula lutaonensis TaxID=491923 RepID=A0ABV7MBE8_9PROT|nr:YfdX family protein [Parvularcula lutaonensis]GGY38387.1 hypothetical protein GCM10007148_03370 [Parvularcula lutaonensis]